jgi:glutamine cyclotransferase
VSGDREAPAVDPLVKALLPMVVALVVTSLGCRAGGTGEGAASGAAAGPPASAAGTPAAGVAAAVERLTVRVVRRYPHDPEAWTQGLVWQDGKLWESTGLVGRSSLRRVDLETGVPEEQAPLPPEVFGEGLALVGGRLVQLTWQDGRAFWWDPSGLALLTEKRYDGEGWGLAWDGARLIQSDGTSRLTWRDPQSFAPLGHLQVTLDGRPFGRLNELELVDGALWANVWPTDDIVRIDPATGRVTARVDASALSREAAQLAAGTGLRVDALNGIAWRPESRTFLLTGKWWPVLFEVEMIPAG